LPHGLLPVQLTKSVKGKPASGPLWWSWEDLLAFRRLPELDFAQLDENGWSPMPDDVRTHVAIERETQAAEAGKLFQTAGLNCWQHPKGKEKLPAGHIGILGRIAGNIDQGLITLGGERRLSAIKEADASIWPALPTSLTDEIRKAGGLTLTLLTPALFAKGWYPDWLNEHLEGTPPGCDGLKLKLRATAMARWQPHSGWDLAKNQARAGRKLLPAGAVFWFEIMQADDHALSALWLTHISDQAQDRCDGFGLALPQPWSPTTLSI
jgi:CRISPR-associated protein Cmr3